MSREGFCVCLTCGDSVDRHKPAIDLNRPVVEPVVGVRSAVESEFLGDLGPTPALLAPVGDFSYEQPILSCSAFYHMASPRCNNVVAATRVLYLQQRCCQYLFSIFFLEATQRDIMKTTGPWHLRWAASAQIRPCPTVATACRGNRQHLWDCSILDRAPHSSELRFPNPRFWNFAG